MNHGCEYLSEQFKELRDEKDIQRQLTISCTLQQNGVAWRSHHMLLDMVRLMMVKAKIPISFWRGAILIAAYILNEVPSKSVPATLYERRTSQKPYLDHVRP